VKVTVPPLFTTGVAIESVLTSAFVDFSVHVDTPDAFVTEHAPYTLVLPVSVAVKVGVTPDTGVLKASFRVMVTVDVATPFATTGVVPVMVELAAAAGPVTVSVAVLDVLTVPVVPTHPAEPLSVPVTVKLVTPAGVRAVVVIVRVGVWSVLELKVRQLPLLKLVVAPVGNAETARLTNSEPLPPVTCTVTGNVTEPADPAVRGPD
jgi:hypothetical protein